MPAETIRTCIRSYVDQEKIDSLREELVLRDDLSTGADTFAMLGNPTRLKILYCLSVAGELCVCDLSDVLGMGVSAISHQLRKLKDRRLVRNRRDGLTIYYSIAPTDQAQKSAELLESILLSAPPEPRSEPARVY